MPANAQGKMEPNKTAGSKANSVTLGPNGSFPAGDPKHQRLAVSGAARSYDAGNISKATEENIQSRARAMLRRGGGGKGIAASIGVNESKKAAGY